MEIAPNKGMPALPSPQRVVTTKMAKIGHQRVKGQPQCILVQARSAVLSITNDATSSSAMTNGDDDADDTPKKRNVPSNDHPLLSGDESDAWEVGLQIMRLSNN